MRSKKLKFVRSMERLKRNIPFYVLYGLQHQPGATYGIRGVEGSFLYNKNEPLWELLWETAEFLSNKIMSPENIMGMLYAGWCYFEERDMYTFYFPKDNKHLQLISIRYHLKGIQMLKHILNATDHSNWYKESYEAFVSLLPNYDIELFTRVYAITSPQVDPWSNARLALQAYYCVSSGISVTVLDCIPPVKKMLLDLEARIFNEDDVTKRRKVINFIKALFGNQHVVVVDSKTLKSCDLGAWYEWEGKTYLRCRKLEYDLIEHYIQSLATASGFKASQLSAMAWVGVRRASGKYQMASMYEILSDVLSSLRKSHD